MEFPDVASRMDRRATHLPTLPIRSVPTRTSALVVTLAACVLTAATPLPDRRVVDVAEAGNPRSEATHGYAGYDVIAGVADGTPFRQARGWMRYVLTTFDDTEVTVAVIFVGDDSESRGYDIIVEDSLIATRTHSAHSTTPTVVEIAVPLAVTRGKSSIAVMVRARGGPTPALRELRTIQDHNEVDQSHNLLGVAR